MKAKSEKVLRLIMRHKIPVLLLYRFVYGFHGVSPFVFGSTSIPARRFVAVNMGMGLAWTLAFGGAGYYAGRYLQAPGVEHSRLRWVFSLSVLAAAPVYYGWWTLRKKLDSHDSRPETGPRPPGAGLRPVDSFHSAPSFP